MTYTTILISGIQLTKVQQDFLVKLGFAISGTTFTKSIQTDLLYTLIQQIVKYSIPFKLNTSAPKYVQNPCNGCKR